MHPTAPKASRFLGLDDPAADPDKARCVILPAPYERTSSYVTGSADGPAAIIEASHQVEFFDCDLADEPHALCSGICTAMPVEYGEKLSEEDSVERTREAVAHWLDRDKFVVTLGGEHTTALGPMLAHADKFEDLTILQFDAHSDLRDQYEGSPYNHACVMRRIYEKHPQIIQIGIRSQCREERAFQEKNNIPMFTARTVHDLFRNEGSAWIRDVLDMTGQNVYVTFDCDAFDPSIIPATGTPEPGGLTWNEVTYFFEALARWRRVVGIDFTELAPVDGLHHPQFTIARLVQRVIGLTFGARAREPKRYEDDLQPDTAIA